MTTWFCDAYASWQKGGVENANGRLRRWLPRQIDIDKVSDQEIQDIVITANLTPEVPGLQDFFSGNPQRAWQRRSRKTLLHLALEFRVSRMIWNLVRAPAIGQVTAISPLRSWV